MIASYSRNFIFIKTRKTGGTSVEIVLSTLCSWQDICTQITPEDEIIRLDYGGRPRNFGESWLQRRALWRAIKTRDPEMIKSVSSSIKARFYNHMSAERVRDALPALWNRAFRFTIERHPYERAVSRAFGRMARRGLTDFPSVLDGVVNEGKLLEMPLYSSGETILVDAVIPHERMWEEIANRLNIALPPVLPSAKSQRRKDHRPAREILSPEQKATIYEQCAPVFEMMGYER